MGHLGHRLNHRIELMRDRTTSAYTRQRNKSASARKKSAALDKYSAFLRNEAIVATVWIIEQMACMVLKEQNVISLQTTPLVIFAMKVVRRLTEWLMVSRMQTFYVVAARIVRYKIIEFYSHRQQLILS